MFGSGLEGLLNAAVAGYAIGFALAQAANWFQRRRL